MAIITLNNNSLSSVTTLPNGIVTASALASGVGGKLLQYAEDSDTASIGLSTTAWVDTNLSIAFTPVSASSRILIFGMVQVYANGAPSYHGHMVYKIQKNGSDFGETYECYSGYGGTEALFNGMLPYALSEGSGSTTARTYKIQVQNPDTNSGAHYNQYAGYSMLQIMEIAY